MVAKGRANTAVYPTWLAVNPKSTTVSVDEKDSNYISQTYTLKSNVDIKSYRVVIDGNVPAGAKVTDVSNKEKTEFFGSELTFKVLIPKDSPKGEFRVLVKSKLENKSVLFGVAHDEKSRIIMFPRCLPITGILGRSLRMHLKAGMFPIHPKHPQPMYRF